MVMRNARIPGSFKLSNQRRPFIDDDPWDVVTGPRVRKIIASIQSDIGEGGRCRVRQILKNPRELYRLELERPDMSYERTTILDRDALTELLETLPEDTVRDSFLFS
jgi:hypothetical protein